MGYRTIISLMPKTTAFDPDAQAFLTAAGITDPTISGAINTLVVQMKADNIWTKMKAIYPMVGGTASTHKFNLKDPRDLDAAFRLTFSGGITHDSNGILPNGTNGYANTHLDLRNNFNVTDVGVSYYSLTNNNNAGGHGVYDHLSGLNRMYSLERFSDGKCYNSIGSDTLSANYNSVNTVGLYTHTRTSTTSLKSYKNGVLAATNTSLNVGTIPNIDFTFMAINTNTGLLAGFFTDRQYAFMALHEGLSDTEAANLYTAVQAFQTTLNRQV